MQEGKKKKKNKSERIANGSDSIKVKSVRERMNRLIAAARQITFLLVRKKKKKQKIN